MVLSSFIFCGGLRKTHVFSNRVHIGHSRSSKVIDFGTNRKGVCDFLLVINSNFGPILHHFWDIRRLIGWKLRIFPSPLSFNDLARGEPFRISGWVFLSRKLESLGYRWWRFHDPSLHRFHSVPACDWQTDGISIIAIVQGLHSIAMLTPCKNKKAQLSLTNPRDACESLLGLRKSSGVVSCIARLSVDSVPMVSYYVPYSGCKMRRFGDSRLLKLPWPWNPDQGSLKVIESDTIR